jgi:hypothetical protein
MLVTENQARRLQFFSRRQNPTLIRKLDLPGRLEAGIWDFACNRVIAL